MPRFPDSFLFGTATSSYQIEGAVAVDGRGESIWDRFAHSQGKVANGETGDVAADHYHRFRDDVELLEQAELDAYRFSISWPRIQPNGSGVANSAGLDFYDRLVDELLAAGVEPWACLFHWDLPQALQDRGGWANRDTVGRFIDYAVVMVEALGDRLQHCLILNEPSIFALLGHLVGHHAPGVRDLDQCIAVSHHLNLATGLTAQALRSISSELQIGNALALNWIDSLTDSAVDRDAAARRCAFMNHAYLEPFFKGTYPELVRDMFQDYVLDGDLENCRGQLDFIGVNYYTRLRVEARRGTRLLDSSMASVDRRARKTEMGWEIYPRGLLQQLLDLDDRYEHPTLYITENGAAVADEPDDDGKVADLERIRFLESHLEVCLEAIEQGVDLRGFFAWSLIDNFEWAEGYGKRFGLVRVDFETQERIPKDSYSWFQRVARSGELREAR